MAIKGQMLQNIHSVIIIILSPLQIENCADVLQVFFSPFTILTTFVPDRILTVPQMLFI